VSADFADKVVALLSQTKGMFSLFNTPAHPVIGSRGPFVLKRTVGSAGTVWTHDLARKMLDAVPAGRIWDWRFSDFLVDSGHEICVLRDSAAQHVGVNTGQNTPAALSGDFGVGFLDDDPRSAYLLIEQIGLGAQAALKALRAELQSAQSTIENLRAGSKAHSEQIECLSSQLEMQNEQFMAAQARTQYLQNRSLIESLLFRSDGRPTRALRRLLFHRSGEPRERFRFIVFHKNGKPRRAFSHWLNAPPASAPPDFHE
jgi:hypothetical protein